MNLKRLVSTMAGAGFMAAASSVFGQPWTLTATNISVKWDGIACSADGTRVAATIPNDGIYISTNSGSTWYLSFALNTNTVWSKIVSSADGLRLAASTFNVGNVYTSADGGMTWNSNLVSPAGLFSMAMSADGTRLVATTTSGVLYLSTNGGTDWSTNVLPVSPFGMSVASSADGTKLAVTAYHEILTSIDSGSTWQVSGAPTNQIWNSVACSADGSILVAGGYSSEFGVSQNGVFVSADSGATWSEYALSQIGYVPLVASSADGTILMAVPTGLTVARDGSIFTSTDSGRTWIRAQAPDASWYGIACSADGAKMYGAAQSTPPGLLDQITDGGIYTLQTAANPALNLKPSGGSLRLSWVLPSSCMTLQQNADLRGGAWSDVSLSPSLNLANLHCEVTLSPTNGQAFYRLKGP